MNSSKTKSDAEIVKQLEESSWEKMQREVERLNAEYKAKKKNKSHCGCTTIHVCLECSSSVDAGWP